ncbi:hypothetical protein Poli38472_011785 [Pythium oligandrum]|uniref:WRKY transcription factor 19 n=1 Tax=Pythium oligandrum TaxID=41045 RepID=A0A8K1C920_PYTOL|nr:hypothetical protein Poli38472_011785 [Pythium oligandrum]|eukprot:TMW58197.1 hypothetical protein Poli38472_011785 [Pythium oligandrum]
MPSKSSIAFLLNPIGVHTSVVPASCCASPGHTVSCKRPSIQLTTKPNKRPQSTLDISPRSKVRLCCDNDSSKPSCVVPVRLLLSSPSSASEDSSDLEQETPTKTTVTKQAKPRRPRLRVRVPTPCTTPGCENFAVTKGVCVRHGGGARCEFEGCEKRAKMNKRCFQHGGYRQCLQLECTSKAKRYGYCWAHGGGINCSVAGCDKVCTQGGLCWAHGGGSRCLVTGCKRRSYQKDEYYCSHHRVNGSSDESAMG